MAGTPEKYKDLITVAANEYGIPPFLLYSQMLAESGGDPEATSSAGARGLLQLMPATAAELGVTDITDPVQNINGGAKYLSKMYAKYGDWGKALSAYQAGPGNVDKYGGSPSTPKYLSNIAAHIEKDAYGSAGQSAKPFTYSSYEDALSGLPGGGTQGGDKATPTETSPKKQFSYSSYDDALSGLPEPVNTKDIPGYIQPDQPSSAPAVQPGQNTPLYNAPEQALSLAKGAAEGSGIGFVERQLGKSSKIRDLSEYLNNKIASAFGLPQMSFEERAMKAQGITNTAVENYPLTNTAGKIGGFIAGPGRFIGAAVSPLAEYYGGQAGLGAVGKALLDTTVQGGIGAGAFEGLTNPEATAGDVAKQAGIGALLGPVVQGTTAGISKVAGGATNYITKKLIGSADKDVIAYLESNPSLLKAGSREGLAQNNQILLEQNAQKLDDVLTKKYQYKVVDLKNGTGVNNMSSGDKEDILKMIDNLQKGTSEEQALGNEIEKRMFNVRMMKETVNGKPVTKFIRTAKNTMSVKDANDVKSIMWGLSKFKNSGDPSASALAQAAYRIGGKFKGMVEDAIPDVKIQNLNRAIGNGVRTRDLLASKEGPSFFSMPSMMRAFGLGSLSPGIGTGGAIAEAASKTVPGAYVSTQTLKGLKALADKSPEYLPIINTFLPGLLK